MARKLEDYLPPLKEDGINTAKNIVTTGTVTAAGVVNSGSQSQAATTITSASANALAVGPAGTTNPTFQVDASTASAATGIKVTSAAAASGVAAAVVSSGTNENLSIDAKGSGTIGIGVTSTGGINLGRATTVNSANAPGAGGTIMARLGNGGPQIVAGSGAPSITAVQGSLYLRTDGSSTSTRAYINTDGATTWTAITTAA